MRWGGGGRFQWWLGQAKTTPMLHQGQTIDIRISIVLCEATLPPQKIEKRGDAGCALLVVSIPVSERSGKGEGHVVM
jgi:hypothetical protein